MNCHLVTVEIGIEGGAHQGMEQDCPSMNQPWLKRLYAEPMQGRGAIEKHRVPPQQLLKNLPKDRMVLTHEPLGGSYVLRQPAIH